LLSTYHLITRNTGMEYGRKQGELIACKVIWRTMSLPVEFSTGIDLVSLEI
jgi:hypothetical protein